ncbi:hypothetical protein AAKU55_002601 [Oxalobacteraceae bacterium GrIS 1.11]
MREQQSYLRNVAAIMAIISLTACGGGGSGSPSAASSADVAKNAPPEPADGLGESGQLPGTVSIGGDIAPPTVNPGSDMSPQSKYLFDEQIVVAMSDEGRALVAWQFEGSEVSQIAAWTQSSASGVWDAAKRLPQADHGYGTGMALRMNAAGNALLGWVSGDCIAPLDKTGHNRVLRFTQGSGWDAKADILDEYNLGSNWDLALLADNSFTSTIVSDSNSAVLRVDAQGGRNIVLQTDPSRNYNTFGSNHHNYFAPLPDGSGLQYRMYDSDVDPRKKTAISARFTTADNIGLSEFPIGTYGGVCNTVGTGYFPITAVTTPQHEGVLAVLEDDDDIGCYTPHLELIRVSSQGGISARQTHVNSPGTYLPLAPVLTVDRLGNALAIWTEASGDINHPQATDTLRMMWSQSLSGAGWSTPQPLMLNLGALEERTAYSPVSLAMNAAGQAVAAVRVNANDPAIMAARFDFSTGWTSWKMVANKAVPSYPKVAINASGQAIVVYMASDQPRWKGHTTFPGTYWVPRIFALRL